MWMRLLYLGIFTAASVTELSAQDRIELYSIYMGGGATAVGEVEEFDPQVGGHFVLGIAYNVVRSNGSYLAAGLELDAAPYWAAGMVEIDVGLGSTRAGRSSLSTPFLGVRAGYGEGTYTKEEFVPLFGGTSEVDNDIYGVPLSLVVGYRILTGGMGFAIDLAPGVFYVIGQDPEVPEAEIETWLPMVQARLAVSFIFGGG